MQSFVRAMDNAWEFYRKRMNIILVFSIPFILSILLLFLVSAPTYISLGGVFIRTGSLPELNLFSIVFTIVAYVLSLFIIADVLTNLNLVIKTRRTLSKLKTEVINALGTYAMRIFYVYSITLLILFALQLLLYELPFQSIIYPLLVLGLSVFLFFVPPAVVIDNHSTPTAILQSISMALRKPHHILGWTILAFVLLSVLKIIADFILPHPFSAYLVLIVNFLFLLPYLIILQTQLYMEKYPLAR